NTRKEWTTRKGFGFLDSYEFRDSRLRGGERPQAELPFRELGLDHRVGHPASFSLSYCSSRWTEGCRRDIDCPQYDSKHRAGLLPEKSLCRRGPVRTREEEVVHRGQTFPLSGAVQSSSLMMPQREVPVASFDIGT